MVKTASVVKAAVVAAAMAAACGRDRGLGTTCDTKIDCKGDLICGGVDPQAAMAAATSAADHVCTAHCSKTEECQADFGEHSFCITGELCVLECGKDSECPPYTGCNEHGWCSRPRFD